MQWLIDIVHDFGNLTVLKTMYDMYFSKSVYNFNDCFEKKVKFGPSKLKLHLHNTLALHYKVDLIISTFCGKTLHV